MKRIVFMGTPEFSSSILEYLHTHLIEINAQIVGVYCQPDKPAGRGNKMQASAVKIKAQELQLPLFQPVNFKKQEDGTNPHIEELAQLKPDILIVAAYGLILPEKVLQVAPYGAYNIHASLLPKWRGAAPVQRGIMAGDVHTGITIMRMEKGLDTGDILLQQAIKIEKDDTTQTLFTSLADIGAKLMFSALKQIFDKRAAFIKQNNEIATYAHKILKEEYLFTWENTAQEIDRKVRALLHPRTEIETKKGMLSIQVLQGKVVDISHFEDLKQEEHKNEVQEKKEKAGSVLLAHSDTLLLATSDTKTHNLAYQITLIKPSGKGTMAIKDFINGYIKP